MFGKVWIIESVDRAELGMIVLGFGWVCGVVVSWMGWFCSLLLGNSIEWGSRQASYLNINVCMVDYLGTVICVDLVAACECRLIYYVCWQWFQECR